MSLSLYLALMLLICCALEFQFITMDKGARVPLKGWQQAAVAVGSAMGALLNPRRADLIASLGETTGKPAFQKILERMKRNPEGRVPSISLPTSMNLVYSHDNAYFCIIFCDNFDKSLYLKMLSLGNFEVCRSCLVTIMATVGEMQFEDKEACASI